jgi:hypothetical protein
VGVATRAIDAAHSVAANTSDPVHREVITVLPYASNLTLTRSKNRPRSDFEMLAVESRTSLAHTKNDLIIPISQLALVHRS